MWRAVSLTAILEPVADLYQRQTCLLRQRSFLLQRRVEVAPVAVLERLARPLLEAVDGLLSVPDCPRQWILPPQPVLIHGAFTRFKLRVIRTTKMCYLHDAFYSGAYYIRVREAPCACPFPTPRPLGVNNFCANI